MRIKIVVHMDADGRYWAELPGLAVHAGEGDTIDEVLAHVADTISAIRRDEAREPPHPDDVPVDGLDEEPAAFEAEEVVATTVDLTADERRFIDDSVAAGRFKDARAVLRSALQMLRRREKAFEDFQASLDDAMAEAEREGTVTLEEAMAAMDRIIESYKR